MNISIDMGEVLTKAWKIIWKFKVLWIFGILAGCASNSGNSFNNGFSNNFGNGGAGGGNGGNGRIPDFFKQFQNSHPEEAIRSFLNQYMLIIVISLLVLCILWLFLYFLGMMGKIGLIKGANKADAGAEKLTFGELWTESLPYFWRMLGLTLLIGLPFFILIVILLVIFFIGIFGFAASASGASNGVGVTGLFAALGIFIPAICCLSIARIIVEMVVEQARNAIVIEDKRVLESLGRGWDVFKRNFLTIILMAVILGVLGGIVGLIIAIPILVIVIPAVAGMVFLHTASSASTTTMLPLVVAGLCCLAYFPVLLIFSGIERSYIQSVWTLTYLRLTAAPPAAPATPPASAETADAQ